MITARTNAAIDRVIQPIDTHQAEVDLYPVGRNLILGITATLGYVAAP